MATVVKRAGSPYWFARYMVDGKPVWKSTKTTVKRDAEAFLQREFDTAKKRLSLEQCFDSIEKAINDLPTDSGDRANVLSKCMSKSAGIITLAVGLFPEDQRDNLLAEVTQRILQSKGNKITVAEGWKAWLDAPDKKRNPGKVTQDSYAGIWKRFSKWAGDQNIEYLHEVTEGHAIAYARHLWALKLSPRTFNGHIKFLGAVWKSLAVEAGLPVNHWRNRTTKKLETEGREPFTAEEIKTMWEKADPTVRMMIALGLFTGLRLADVVSLKWANIGKGIIEVIPHKTAKSKKAGSKKVTVPVHPQLEVLLAAYKHDADSDYLFPAEHKTYSQDRSRITDMFQAFLVDDCKITTMREIEEGGNRKRRAVVKGFHSLRHSFVSLCAAGNVPQHVVQQLVGHGSPAMTEKYTHISDAQKQTAIAQLNVALE